MYELAKNIIKTLLPNSVIKSQGRNLRKIYAVFLKGENHACNICNAKLRKFVTLNSNDLLCPNCGSLPRTRGLWQVVKEELKDKTVLHFSPSQALKEKIENEANTKDYITTDFEGEFEASQKYDITNIQLNDNSIDLIICYHILEHIEQDIQAMHELFRVLKDDGICYVQTPFKEGTILEDKLVTTPEERLKRFGQTDHVRIYSPEGLKERLETSGFQTEIIEIENEPSNYYGLKTRDIILRCVKRK